GGIPRRLNTIADNALFESFLAGRVSATKEDVRRAADELEMGEGADAPAKPARRSESTRPAPAPARRAAPQPTDLDSAFDNPPSAPVHASPRGQADRIVFLSEDQEMDDVVAAPTPPPRVRGASRAAAAAFKGRGAPDKTMILGPGEA